MHSQAIAVFSEILALDQRIRAELAKALPKGMEISHFSVLNHMATVQGERTPAQLAKVLNVSRGAMSNTLGKLEARGYIHIHPDWNDARQKHVTISEAGRLQRDLALQAIAPVFTSTEAFETEDMRQLLHLLREMRIGMSDSPVQKSA